MDPERKKFFNFNPYFNIAKAMMPDYPVVSAATKNRIASEAAVFIPRQISKQPYYIFVPLKAIIYFLSIFLYFQGASSISLLKSVPYGRMLERMLRSLVILIFFENHEVLSKLVKKMVKKEYKILELSIKKLTKKCQRNSKKV